jgi:hypothetical protein
MELTTMPATAKSAIAYFSTDFMLSILEHLACPYPTEKIQEGRFSWENAARADRLLRVSTGEARNNECAQGFPIVSAKLLRFPSRRLIFPRLAPINQSGALKLIQRR